VLAEGAAGAEQVASSRYCPTRTGSRRGTIRPTRTRSTNR